MLKILKNKWAANEHILREEISNIQSVSGITYEDLVKLTFSVIYDKIKTDAITVIDDGDYQGTLLFVMPFKGYQPGPSEYLMTYVDYGSCSACDTLEGIKDWSCVDHRPNADQIKDLLDLCRYIVMNTVMPYKFGWRYNEDFAQVEEGE